MEYRSKRRQIEITRSQLDQDYNTFVRQYTDLNDYILPSRGRFHIQDNNRGDRRNTKIYDPTGYLSARTLASGFQAGVTSPAKEWRRLSTPDPELAEFGAVREWLDVVNRRMSTYFGRSNLYNNLHTGYGDLGVFGTAAIFMDKDPKTVSTFMSFPLGTYRIAKDHRGRVNVFHRDFRMTVRQMIDMFGREDEETGKPNWNVFSPHVRRLYERGEYEVWIDISHTIEPNQEFNPRLLDSKYKRFYSCYYERNMPEDSSQTDFLREKGYDYFPVLVPRWQVTGNDVYGTDCPGMVAIGDIKQLQHGERRIAQAIDKMVNPPMSASSGLKNSKTSIISGDIVYLDDPSRDVFRPSHEVRIDLSHIENKQAQVRERIKRSFFEDLFLMLAASDRREYTATEIMERKEEKMLAVGPVLEQLNQDVLDPLVDNQFLLMAEAGLIPPAPEELQGQDLKVEYISIMAQAQKLVGIGALDRILQMTTAVVALDPSAINKIDLNQYIDEYSDSLGASPKIVRSDEKVEEIKAQQAEAAQRQQRMEAINVMSGAAKNLSQADMSGDSALTRLAEQAGAGQLVQQ